MRSRNSDSTSDLGKTCLDRWGPRDDEIRTASFLYVGIIGCVDQVTNRDLPQYERASASVHTRIESSANQCLIMRAGADSAVT
jgi:hypothetical protein